MFHVIGNMHGPIAHPGGKQREIRPIFRGKHDMHIDMHKGRHQLMPYERGLSDAASDMSFDLHYRG
jgi:hypothetical protein